MSSSSKRKANESETGSAPQAKKVHPMFAPPAAVKLGTRFKWHAKLKNTAGEVACLHGTYGIPRPASKIAAFDIDGTLIKIKKEPGSSRVFPRDEYDWVLWSSTVKAQLEKVHSEGFAILLLSNQKYKGKKLEQFERKMVAVASELDVPFHLFAANLGDEFRKPGIGMWETFLKTFNGGLDADMNESYFVGDAAGRKAMGDHSDSDKVMAENAGLKFQTPEDYFPQP